MITIDATVNGRTWTRVIEQPPLLSEVKRWAADAQKLFDALGIPAEFNVR